MLTSNQVIGEVSNLARYFTEHLMPELIQDANKLKYYMENEGTTWEGKLTPRLNLKNKAVVESDFVAIANNQHPDTGERITKRNVKDRRIAWDWTFSAVKSASIAMTLGNDPEIKQIHENAVRIAMQAMERDLLAQANTHVRGYEDVSEGLWCSFIHQESRAVLTQLKNKSAYVPEMNLHSHNLLFNMVWSESRQCFLALENQRIKYQAPFYEAIFHSHFSKGLKEAGYSLRQTPEGRYEINGISRSTIEKYSSRTKEIEQIIRDKKITDAKAKAQVGALNRVTKSKAEDLSKEELLEVWKERLTPDELNALQNLKTTTFSEEKPLTPAEAVSRAIEHWSERESAFMEKRIIATALSYTYGSCLPEDIEKELQSRPDIVRKEIDKITYMTTHELIRIDETLMKMSVEGKFLEREINPHFVPKGEITPNDQQAKAIKDVLTSRSRISLINGAAGTGKSLAIKLIQQGIQEAGLNVHGYATSSQATDLLRQDGMNASTLASLIHNPKSREAIRGGVMLIDEASLVSSADMLEIFRIAEAENARIVLSGDFQQHKSIGAGNCYKMLHDKAKLPTASVNKILRQKDPKFREAITDLSKNRTLQGYQKLDRLGAVHEIEDHETRINQICDDAIASRLKKRSNLIISPTNAEGALINEVMRTKLREKGLLKGKDHEIKTLHNLNLTLAERRDLNKHESGNIIRLTKAIKGGYKAGEEYQILERKKGEDFQVKNRKTGEVKPLPPKPEHYQIYREQNTNLAVGDTIRLKSNVKTKEDTHIFNGTTHQIKSISNKTGEIKLSNGKTLPRGFGLMALGYSESSYASQGKSVQDVFISMSDLSYSAASSEQFYVSASRFKERIKIYTNSKDELKKAIQRNREPITATDLTDGQPLARLQQQNQRNHHRSLNEKIKEHAANKQRSWERSPQPSISKTQGYER
ncbi:MAG: MobF family relaxase [Bacteroidota bacterium]